MESDRPCRHRVTVAPVLALLFVVARLPFAHADSIGLVEIREHAAQHVLGITTISFDYSIVDSLGLKSKVHFDAKGGLFHIDRVDVKAGAHSPTEQNVLRPIHNRVTAFNGERSQFFDRTNRALILSDGVNGANYPAPIPAAFVFSWLLGPDEHARFDELQRPELWDRRFEDATYRGPAKLDRVECEIVEFPQEHGVQTKCYYRVYFAKDLDYAPVRYERFTANDLKLASFLRVDRYKMVIANGRSVAIPMQVYFEQNGADGVSLAFSDTFSVDESTLHVNEPIDDRIFTIPVELASTVYDSDQQHRVLKAIDSQRPALINKTDQVATSSWLIVLTCVGIVAIATYVVYRRMKAGNEL